MARRRRRRLRRRPPIGAAPGTLILDPEAPRPKLSVIAYGPEGLYESALDSLEPLRELRARWPIVWLNVDGLGDLATLRAIGELFGLHPLTVEDIVHVNQRAKVEPFADYDFIVDINLKGPFLLSQAIGRQMLQRGRGNQINIVSLNNYAPLKHVLPYAVSKAGLGHMTRSLALEWGPRGVRVNAIAPGFILTDLTQALWARPDMQAWGLPNTPLRRLGVPDDLIGAAVHRHGQLDDHDVVSLLSLGVDGRGRRERHRPRDLFGLGLRCFGGRGRGRRSRRLLTVRRRRRDHQRQQRAKLPARCHPRPDSTRSDTERQRPSILGSP